MALAKVVYASLTGNNEEIADIVGDKLEELGLEVEIDECTSVDAIDFEEADLCVVVTYTYGEGDMPDEIVDLYEDLKDLTLTGKIFGVCGSGDTFYEQFCKSVEDFDEAFYMTGAERGAEMVKIDLAAEDEDIEKLEAFATELASKLS